MTRVAQARPGRKKGCVKTGGRQKGTPNKVKGKAALEKQALAAAVAGETPLEFLLRVMRDDEQPMETRIGAAKAAAPYCHRQLKAVDINAHITHGISKELADFIAGNAGAARSFLGFDEEDTDPENEAD